MLVFVRFFFADIGDEARSLPAFELAHEAIK
jgi:hypothetical protein